MLAASTPNDGAHERWTVPNTATTHGRIKVEAIGNVYFDVNNADITINAGQHGAGHHGDPVARLANRNGWYPRRCRR